MDEKTKKRALMLIPYGLFVIGVRNGEHCVAFTVNWLSQASFRPPLIMAGIKKGSRGYEMIKSSGAFVVNMLAKGQEEVAAAFFRAPRSNGDTIGGRLFRRGATGGPVLEDAPAYLECRVTDIIAGGDHSIVIGQVVHAEVRRQAEPMTMAQTGWKYAK